MNIACSNDALPKMGCLFFKVLRNTSVIYGWFDCRFIVKIKFSTWCVYVSFSTAKFDCTVPGTLYDFTGECNIATTEEAVSETIISSTTVTVSTVTVSTVTSINTVTTRSPNATNLINVFIPVVVLMGLALATATVIIIVTCYCTYARRSPVIQIQADVIHRDSDSRMDQHAHLDLQTEMTEGNLLVQELMK